MQALTQTATYGRKILVVVAALVILWLQVAGGSPMFLAVLTIGAQLAAIFFGGSPGSLAWLLFSRRPTKLLKVRRWDGAFRAFALITCIEYLAFSTKLSSNFLGLSGAFLFLIYFCAKQGCYRIGCCGWSLRSTSFQWLRGRIPLQKLEAVLSVTIGCALLVVVTSSTVARQEVIWIGALAIHAVLRHAFSTARDQTALIRL